MSIIEKRAANPIATHKYNSPIPMYPDNVQKSKEKFYKSDSATKERLETGIWQIMCLLQGGGLPKMEKNQGWQLFDSYLRDYIEVVHEGGAA